MLDKYKNRLFGSNYTKIYDDYITVSNKHFASGWIWFIYDNNNIIIVDTQDAELPKCELKNILMCIDVWEHAYYTEYVYNRSDYISNIFYLINWERIYNTVIKISS